MIERALTLYERIITPEFVSRILAGAGIVERDGPFQTSIILWLMIFQRLHPDHTLSAAIEELRSGYSARLLERARGSIRARTGRISGDTSGIAHSRERIGCSVVEKSCDALNREIESHTKAETIESKVYIIDGSSIRLSHTKKNIEKYPQYANQHGAAHFPLLRLGIATHAISGVAVRPSIGPYNGDEAVNELGLAEELFPRLPPGSIVVGDRYFGCIRFVMGAKASGHEAICRVKEKNCRHYVDDSPAGEKSVLWISKRDKVGVSGRFIWKTIAPTKTGAPERLILFTSDMSLTPKKILEFYGLRWNIELDLRDIKSTLEMDEVAGKTPDMIAKEIAIGVTAYNLIRHVMVQMGKRAGVQTRRLSFSRFLKRLNALSGPMLFPGSITQTELALRVERALLDVKSLELPKRNKKLPNEPRKLWPKGSQKFMTSSREEERKKLN